MFDFSKGVHFNVTTRSTRLLNREYLLIDILYGVISEWEMYEEEEEREESNASFIALPSDQILFDDGQHSMPQRKRKRIVPQSVSDG